jgi:hypothetical protein
MQSKFQAFQGVMAENASTKLTPLLEACTAKAVKSLSLATQGQCKKPATI